MPMVWKLARRRKSRMKKNPHAVALGRKGGKKTSDAKRIAAQRNGRKGGRKPKP